MLYIFFLLLIQFSSLALTCNLYVSPDGEGISCSFDNPCSFQTALNKAKIDGRNTTVCLSGGIYSITDTLRYDNEDIYPENNNLTIVGETDIEGNPTSIISPSFSGTAFKIDTCVFSGEECEINRTGRITLKNIKIRNVSGGRALEIKSSSGNIILENISIENTNSISLNGAVFIYSENGHISLNSISIKNNRSYRGGFFIKTVNGNILLKDGDIYTNIGTVSGGGYIYSKNGNIVITDSIFLQNRGDRCGGGILEVVNGNMYIINNNILGNTATDRYGGLCIFVDNDTPEINIYNSIFWNNSSSGYGQDIYINDDNDNNLRGAYTNIRNNFASCDIDTGFPITCFDIERGNFLTTFQNITDTSPGFILYPTDLHLETGSICIDRGNSSAPFLPDKDKDGNERIHGISVDIGVYEYGSRPTSFRINIIKVGEGRVYSSPSFIDCGNTCSSEVPASYSYITLFARASAGYLFQRWEGDCVECENNLSCTIYLDRNKSCRAVFSSISGGGGCSFFAYYSFSQSLINSLYILIIPAIILLRRLKKN